MGSGNQELDWDIIFKYFVRHPSGDQVSSWLFKSGVELEIKIQEMSAER